MASQLALNSSEEILLAAADLYNEGIQEFSEWDLSVYAWKRNKNKFGCRGYEDHYPDHKRVMSEIMGKTKPSNPLRKGWLEKTRVNHYKITKLGLAEADRIKSQLSGVKSNRKSTADIYDAVRPYITHNVFEAYLNDKQEPKTWLGGAAFLGINSYDPTTLNDKITHAESAVLTAIRWLDENSVDDLKRGPAGGGKAFTRNTLEILFGFIKEIQDRFSNQINAIRKMPQKRG